MAVVIMMGVYGGSCNNDGGAWWQLYLIMMGVHGGSCNNDGGAWWQL